MKIGILSDSHGRQHTVQAALALLRERGVRVILHCGDIDDADTVRLFAGFEPHFVFGNCDHDREELEEAMTAIGATSHGAWGMLEREGCKVAWTHGDDQGLLDDLRRRGQFQFVFYGHTHQAAESETGPTRVVNPGALHRARPKTFVVLDLATGELESVVVE